MPEPVDEEEFWEEKLKRAAKPCIACGMPLGEDERVIHVECEDDK